MEQILKESVSHDNGSEFKSRHDNIFVKVCYLTSFQAGFNIFIELQDNTSISCFYECTEIHQVQLFSGAGVNGW